MAKWCHGLGCSVSEVGWELALEFHWPKLQDHLSKTDQIAYVYSYRRPAKAGKRVRPSGLQQTSPYSKLHIWGLGLGLGLGAPGPDGPVVPQRAPKAVRPSKEAVGGAFQSDKKTTSPRFQSERNTVEHCV